MKKLLALAALAFASVSTQAAANECELTVTTGDKMAYDQTSLSVPASCSEVTLTLEHQGSMPVTSMGHNWVLSETSNLQDIAMKGAGAGPNNDYLPQGDDRILAHTKLIGGGESTTITFSTEGLKGKDLTYFCSFPGHWTVMKGKFTIQ